MNKFVLAAALALLVSGAAQAKLIELVPEPAVGSARVQSAAQPGSSRHPQALVLPSRLPELPEPEVFAMMLVGLVLIGYRARRESSEKFK